MNERITTFFQVLHTSRKYKFTYVHYLSLYAYISCRANVLYVKMSGMTSNISTVAIFMIAIYSCGNITRIFLSSWSVYTEGPLKVTQWFVSYPHKTRN